MNYNTTVLLIIIPILSSFLVYMPVGLIKKSFKIIFLATILFNLLFSLKIFSVVLKYGNLITIIGNYHPPFGINLVSSFFSILFLIALYIVFLISAIIFIFKNDTKNNQQKISSVLLLYLASFSEIILTGDLFNLFVFFEIFSISNIIIISLKNEKFSLKGSIKYLLISSIGSALLLFAIGYIYAILGTLNLAEIALNFEKISFFSKCFIIFFLMGSILSELEVFPFNLWISDSYAGAKNFVNILLSGISCVVSLYIFIRMFFTIFNYPSISLYSYNFPLDIKLLLLTFFSLSIIVNQLVALTSKNIKRILAFSSAATISTILFALTSGTKSGFSSAILLIISTIISKPLLFLSSHQITKGKMEKNLDSFKNGINRKRYFSILFIVSAIFFTGFPLTPAFFGKLMLFYTYASKLNYYTYFIIVIIFSITVEFFYYFRMIHKLFIKDETERENKNIKNNLSISYFVSGLTMISILIIFFIFPNIYEKVITKMSEEIFNQKEYIQTILKLGEK